MTVQARPMASLMPFHAGRMAFCQSQMAMSPTLRKNARSGGNTVVESQFQTAPTAVLMPFHAA